MCSLVAEADSSSLAFCWYTTFDAGDDTRDSKTRLATLALDGFSFIPLTAPERKRVDKVGAWCRSPHTVRALAEAALPRRRVKLMRPRILTAQL
jgi:hypothetical protein